MSDIRAMVVGDLSAVEQRNLECLEAWAKACTLPGGSVARTIDDLYAEQPEVVLVLTDTYVARPGQSKQAWRDAEIRLEAQYASRSITFTAVQPRGDTIAVEARVEQVLKNGTRRGWPVAVFLNFDASGRIVGDRNYMLPHPNQGDFEGAAAAVRRGGAQQHGR